MKERPILFSAPMVRALLDGRKTQTRRVVKNQGVLDHPVGRGFKVIRLGNKEAWLNSRPDHPQHVTRFCPYGQPSDRLWVKETFGITESAPYADGQSDEEIIYRADGWKDDGGYFKWKPSIFMPRHASRIMLEITAVRVERLQDISEEDAKAEGVSFGNITDQATGETDCDAVEAYERVWESINGAGSWDANPWVWAIEFKRIEQ